MTNLLLEIEVEGTHIPRRVHVEDRLIGFERFLEMAREQYVDLINGAIVEKPVIQLDHSTLAISEIHDQPFSSSD